MTTPTARAPFQFIGCVELRQALDQRAARRARAAGPAGRGAGGLDLLPHARLLPPPPAHHHRLRQRLRGLGGRPRARPGAGRAAGRRSIPSSWRRLEELREELVSVIHDHLLRLPSVPRVEFGEAFHFQQSHIVEVPLGAGRRHPGGVPRGPGRGGRQRDLLPHGGGADAAGAALGRLRRVDPRLAGAAGAGRAHRAHRRLHDEPRARAGPRAVAGGRTTLEDGGGDDHDRRLPAGGAARRGGHAPAAGRAGARAGGCCTSAAGRFGGGAAEILPPLVPMLADLGRRRGWEITGGDPGFYTTAAAPAGRARGRRARARPTRRSTTTSR